MTVPQPRDNILIKSSFSSICNMKLELQSIGPSPYLTYTEYVLLEHVGLPHVLDLAVHLVNFFGWVSQGDHSEPLLLLALFY